MGTHDLTRATVFYDAVLAPLGIKRVANQYQDWAAWQPPGEGQKFWVGLPYNQLPASWGNGTMVAFAADSRTAVDAAYAAAIAAPLARAPTMALTTTAPMFATMTATRSTLSAELRYPRSRPGSFAYLPLYTEQSVINLLLPVRLVHLDCVAGQQQTSRMAD